MCFEWKINRCVKHVLIWPPKTLSNDYTQQRYYGISICFTSKGLHEYIAGIFRCYRCILLISRSPKHNHVSAHKEAKQHVFFRKSFENILLPQSASLTYYKDFLPRRAHLETYPADRSWITHSLKLVLGKKGWISMDTILEPSGRS